jgi:hypothetical protein
VPVGELRIEERERDRLRAQGGARVRERGARDRSKAARFEGVRQVGPDRLAVVDDEDRGHGSPRYFAVKAN